ncbi:dihydrolipoyllysine-residue acetyltransferase [Aureococcus anophagefferens]|nr:dihydrolipoyllysine-residue acetyltransferase [Aureococcus anophagefferens]
MVVESDKADMEVESFDEGYVAAILVDEGTEAAVGDVVALLAPTEAAIAEVAATAPAAARAGARRAPPRPRRPPRPPRPRGRPRRRVGLREEGRRGRGRRRRRRRRAAGGASPLAAPRRPRRGARETVLTPTPGATTATPKAAKLAKSKNLTSRAWPHGPLRRHQDDAKKALGIAEPAKPKLVPAGGPAPPPAGVVDMTGMQKAIAKNMEATLAVPVFRVSKTVRTDAFDALYQKLKPDGVTVSALLAKAVAGALVKTPLMNAKYEPGAFSYNGDLSLADLSAEWKSLVGKAKSGSLKPEEYTTGTFTISNLGMFDVAQFDAILPPGQGAILAISSSKNVVVPMPGSLLGVGIEKQMTVTVTCDHRIISGADAAVFLKDFAAAVENPATLTK